MATVSLREQRGIFQAVITYKDDNGIWKHKWNSTGLKAKGNKKQAMVIAERFLAEFENNAKNSSNSNNENKNEILFIDFIKDWLEVVRNTIEPSTYTSYNQIISDRIAKYFTANKIKLIDIEPIQIQKYYNHLFSEGLSGNTVIHHHAIIRKCLDYAFKLDIIPNNPADKIQRPRKEQFISEFYNENELNKLFEESKGDPMELIILITAFYGLRRSEVLGLKWNAFDFESKTITIKHTVTIATLDGKRQLVAKDRTKNKSSHRTLPLLDEVITELFEAKEKQMAFKKEFGKDYCKEYADYVFVNPQGKLVRPDYISQHFKILLENKELKHIRFHDLRHSCASLLLAKGVPMKSIQEWLGHSNYSTTANIYAHLDSNSKQLSADTLGNAFNFSKKENEESNSSSSNELISAVG